MTAGCCGRGCTQPAGLTPRTLRVSLLSPALSWWQTSATCPVCRPYLWNGRGSSGRLALGEMVPSPSPPQVQAARRADVNVIHQPLRPSVLGGCWSRPRWVWNMSQPCPAGHHCRLRHLAQINKMAISNRGLLRPALSRYHHTPSLSPQMWPRPATPRLHVFGGAPSGLNGTEGMPAVDRPSRPRRSEAGIPEGRCGNEAWWHGLGAIYLHRTEALTSGRNHEVVLQ